MKLITPALAAVALLSLGLLHSLPTKADIAPLPNGTFARINRQSDSGTPGNRLDAASRPVCSTPTLLMLVPENATREEIAPGVSINDSKDVWGSTVSDAPSLWLSLDRPIADASLEVLLEDSSGEIVYTDQKDLSASPGAFAVKLPEGSLADLNRLYRWQVKVNISDACNNSDESKTLTLSVYGWIERVSVPDEVAIAQTPKALASTYAEAGIWFDTVDTLAGLYRANPNDAWTVSAWDSLMEAGNLDVPASQLVTADPTFSLSEDNPTDM